MGVDSLSNGKSNRETLETLEQLEETIESQQTGIIEIKPKVIFQLVEKTFERIPIYHLPIPSSKIGSVTTLEASLICSILNLKKPKVIFEFGTFLGYTTSTILHNTRLDSKIYSIDLPSAGISENGTPEIFDWDLVKSDDAYNDRFLTSLVGKSGETYLTNMEQDSRLILLKQNSLEFDPAALNLIGNTDFIFLDGGHTQSVVRSDSTNSLRMLSNTGILIWHDYNSSIHKKVTEVVNNYSKNNLVITVKNTMLAITSKKPESLLKICD